MFSFASTKPTRFFLSFALDDWPTTIGAWWQLCRWCCNATVLLVDELTSSLSSSFASSNSCNCLYCYLRTKPGPILARLQQLLASFFRDHRHKGCHCASPAAASAPTDDCDDDQIIERVRLRVKLVFFNERLPPATAESETSMSFLVSTGSSSCCGYRK